MQGLSLAISDSATTLTAVRATNSFTVKALINGKVDTAYTGTVQFSSSDPNVSLPASYTFTAADDGTHTFSLVFKTVGSQTISVTDATNELYNLDWGISVRPAAAAARRISGIPIKPSRVSRRT